MVSGLIGILQGQAAQANPLQANLTKTNLTEANLTEVNASESSSIDVDIPEEILRTEIIVEARSPLTGELLTAAEYAQLQASLDREGRSPQLNSDIRQLVYLLRLRRILKPIIPFIKEQQAVEKQQDLQDLIGKE